MPLTATTLAQSIQQLWAANPALCDPASGIPADRVITGRVPPSLEMPYCRLEVSGGAEQQLSNENQYRTAAIAFHVWSDTFDAGDAIAPVIRASLANMAFDWSGGGCLRMKPEGPPVSRQTNHPEIKAWETVQRFTATIYEQRFDNLSSSSGS